MLPNRARNQRSVHTQDWQQGKLHSTEAANNLSPQPSTAHIAPVQAYECVCEEAVQQVGVVVTNMLAGSPAQLVERLVAAGCNIAIIGRNQVHTRRTAPVGACALRYTIS